MRRKRIQHACADTDEFPRDVELPEFVNSYSTAWRCPTCSARWTVTLHQGGSSVGTRITNSSRRWQRGVATT